MCLSLSQSLISFVAFLNHILYFFFQSYDSRLPGRKNHAKLYPYISLILQALEKINTTQEVAVEGCHYAIVRHSHLEDLSKFIGVHFTPDETLASSINMPYNAEMDHIYRTEVSKGGTS